MTISKLTERGDLCGGTGAAPVKSRNYQQELRLANAVSKDRTTQMVLARLHAQHHSEKERMGALNGRLTAYLAKVKHLESVNEQLRQTIHQLKADIVANSVRSEASAAMELALDNLRRQLGSRSAEETDVYVRLRRAHWLSEASAAERAQLEARATHSTASLHALTAYEAQVAREVPFLRDQVDFLARKQRSNAHELAELERRLGQLNSEREHSAQASAQHAAQALQLARQIAFAKALHELLRAELRALDGGSSSSNRSSAGASADVQFYRAELKRSVHEIRQDYEASLKRDKSSLFAFFSVKLEQLESDCQLRRATEPNTDRGVSTAGQVSRLERLNADYQGDIGVQQRKQSALERRLVALGERLAHVKEQSAQRVCAADTLIDHLHDELQQHADMCSHANKNQKLSVELGIYRRLLESAAAGTGDSATMPPPPQPPPQPQPTTTKTTTITSPATAELVREATGNKGESPREFTGKISNFKQIKGPVGIKEVSIDSKCLVVENLSEQRHFDLTGWRLKRKIVDSQSTEIEYLFPNGTTIGKRSRLNIWTRGVNVVEDPTSDLINAELQDWSTGRLVVTKLFDAACQLRAKHIQKTMKDSNDDACVLDQHTPAATESFV